MRRFFSLTRLLTVRLPNHLGDACMALPALDLLAKEGFALRLAGRPWGASLFRAGGWPYIALRGSILENVSALRAARAADGSAALLLTNSFSTALEFRLAGYAASGYARGCRSWLLQRAFAVESRDHMVAYYYRLAASLVGNAAPAGTPFLPVSEAAKENARAARRQAGVTGLYVVLCPIAIGTHRGRVKAWDGFTRLADALAARGIAVVSMPGPGETTAVRAALPRAIVLPEADVATFAALLAEADLVVANDSGSGHLAAAVGARLVSVFGVTELEHTRPLGAKVTIVGSSNAWPSYEEVEVAVVDALASPATP